MKAVKNCFPRLFRNAGPFVIDANPHLVVHPGGRDLDETAGGEKLIALSIMIVDRSRKTLGIAHDDGRFLARPSEGHAGHRLSRGDVPKQPTSCSMSGPRSTGSNLARAISASVRAASLMSPISRSSRIDIVASDFEELLPERRVLHPLEPVDGGAERGQRILELMGHIGGEMLDIVHAVAERLAHVGHGASKQTDLVRTGGQARHVHLASSAQPHAMRRERKPSKRADDRPGEEQREKHGQEDGEAHGDEERSSLTSHDPREIEVVGSQQDDTVRRRRSSGKDRRQVGRVAGPRRLSCPCACANAPPAKPAVRPGQAP